MEADKIQLEVKLNNEGYIYVFETKEESKPPSKLRQRVWQVFPSVCAMLMTLPYGLMLGWPSPTYPTLIQPESPVWISMDQSAMVAGFLMVGNSVGTPFSSFRRLEPKYGIILAVLSMTVGWILMWKSQDIFWLLGSRFLIGAGNGFGIGQLKFYISEICQDDVATLLIKEINLYVLSGVVLAFSVGPFVDFRQFGIICAIISIMVLFLTIFLPSSPRELLRRGKVTEAKKLIAFLSPHLDADEEVKKVKEGLHAVEKDASFCDILKDSSQRKNFLIFAFAVFFAQYSGAPATMVYTEIIFTRFGSPRPEICAIIYALTFLLANAYGLFCTPNYNKKNMLLISSVGVSLLILLIIIVIVQRINETFWNFTALVVLLLFITVHTVGLGSVPVTLIPSLFSSQAKRVVTHFFIIFHSVLALTITKIFQVMIHRIGLYAPFCLFLVISSFSIIFVIICVPNTDKTSGNK